MRNWRFRDCYQLDVGTPHGSLQAGKPFLGMVVALKLTFDLGKSDLTFSPESPTFGVSEIFLDGE